MKCFLYFRPSWSIQKDDRGKNNKIDSFHDFEKKTSDAWDDGDDDLIQMANLKLSLSDVHSSAKIVLDNHSKLTSSLQKQQQKEHTDLNSSSSKSITFYMIININLFCELPQK